jgi:hypothetical protein
MVVDYPSPPQGRARIAAAQRARWAKVKGRKVVPVAKGTGRTLSAAARRKIVAAQKAPEMGQPGDESKRQPEQPATLIGK